MGRILTIGFAIAVGIALLVAVFLRQNRVTTLKAERAQILVRLADPAAVPPPTAPAEPLNFKQNAPSPSLELLQLRAEVTKLGNRKRELANVREESERLHAQFATQGTNVPGAVALPAGYIRMSQARNLGYNTPEATMETMLWAIQNRDSAGFLQVFDPEAAKQLEPRMQSLSSSEEFFKDVNALPGMRIVGKEAGTDGEVVFMVEIMPGVEKHARLRFKQLGGQWKLVGEPLLFRPQF